MASSTWSYRSIHAIVALSSASERNKSNWMGMDKRCESDRWPFLISWIRVELSWAGQFIPEHGFSPFPFVAGAVAPGVWVCLMMTIITTSSGVWCCLCTLPCRGCTSKCVMYTRVQCYRVCMSTLDNGVHRQRDGKHGEMNVQIDVANVGWDCIFIPISSVVHPPPQPPLLSLFLSPSSSSVWK